jgi:hypothetical protein
VGDGLADEGVGVRHSDDILGCVAEVSQRMRRVPDPELSPIGLCERGRPRTQRTFLLSRLRSSRAEDERD